MRTATDDALDAALGAAPRVPSPGPRLVRAEALTGHQRVSVDDLHPDPANPRESLRDIAGLAESITSSGLIQPIIVRTSPGGLVVVAGHRRLEAVKRLGWTAVEVIIRKPMEPDEVLQRMLVENGQRAGLDPIEEARALKRLKVQRGCTDAELGKVVGLSQHTVSNRIALLALPVEEQEAIRAGQITLTEAVHVARTTSGTFRPGAQGKKSAAHLAPGHPLAVAAKARCMRTGHKRGGSASVGGMACGACWESVIRADERQHLQEHTATRGECPICGTATS